MYTDLIEFEIVSKYDCNTVFQDAELLSIVTEAFNDAYDTLYSEDGWKEEKKNDEGDIVMSKKSKKGQSSTSSMGWLTLQKNFSCTYY